MPSHFVINLTAASTTASTASPGQPLNQFPQPFNVGFGVNVSGGVTYSVQHTFEKDLTAATKWFDHSDVSGETTDQDGNYAFPINAIRVQIASGEGKLNMHVRQSGL